MAHLIASTYNSFLLNSSSSFRCNKVEVENLGDSSRDLTFFERSSERGRKSRERQRGALVPFCSSSSTSVGLEGEGKDRKLLVSKEQFGYLVSEFGWKVRRLVEEEDEMRRVAQVQAEAFHDPVILFNGLFFEFFKAEVFSGLVYKLRNSPPDRYACLVAEAADTSNTKPESPEGLVGVADVTVLRDEVVLRHLEGAEEYLYVSGIAVSKDFRRRKVATALLKACDMLSLLWGFNYLALRAYEDDLAAHKLYGNAGYRVVSGDSPWLPSWIGSKRRVLMIKRSTLGDWC
ncbi:uncharacterized protein LOC122081526 isoform X2 [Macadamia integrifolia]|uniref:uncharacterized protein LOC122081526 isoform X2 n=1 Tax=Macadamia integrifolia TaxID=60698 RepID=UPI001C4FD6C3|nr:uncharacterized protein LOC122081526 isoform X2 [Macadamia integrifolia]